MCTGWVFFGMRVVVDFFTKGKIIFCTSCVKFDNVGKEGHESSQKCLLKRYILSLSDKETFESKYSILFLKKD